MKKFFIAILFLLAIMGLFAFFFKSNSPTGNTITNLPDSKHSILNLEIALPCSGHGILIINALNNLEGVIKVEYAPIKNFKVYYDESKISESEILSLTIFKQYPAKKI